MTIGEILNQIEDLNRSDRVIVIETKERAMTVQQLLDTILPLDDELDTSIDEVIPCLPIPFGPPRVPTVAND